MNYLKCYIIVFLLILTAFNPVFSAQENLASLSLEYQLTEDGQLFTPLTEDIENNWIHEWNMYQHFISSLSPEKFTVKFQKNILQADNIQTDSIIISYETVSMEVIGAVFDGLRLEFAAIELTGNPQITFRDIGYKKLYRVVDGAKVQFRAEILERDLNDYLVGISEKIKVNEPKVELRDGLIYLSGRVKMSWLRAHVTAEGNFNVSDGKFINFNPRYVKTNQMMIPYYTLKRFTKMINPLLDISEFPFEIRIEEIILENGRMIFR